ncbi:MAG: CopG family transcriptional regulator [Chloroflexi bacterium]|nr:CopG family transcriptional regulator [Chloroflexota bacterium]
MLDKCGTVRTTVMFPAKLLQRNQNLVDSGQSPNRNALIVTALEQFIARLEREEIDRQFATLSGDAAYQALQNDIAESFAKSDWEALRQSAARRDGANRQDIEDNSGFVNGR